MRYKEIIRETSTAGGTSAGSVATVTGGLGAGDPKASIYHHKTKKTKKLPLIRRVNTENNQKD